MADFLPWFKVYPSEALSDERFASWTLAERGAWFTLLLVAWREGSVPADPAALARLLHADATALQSHWQAIGDRFVEHPDHPGRLTSPRLEREREAGMKLLKKKSEAGKVGATSRWDKKKQKNGSRISAASSRNATGMRFDSASGQDQDQDQPQDDDDNAAAARAPRLPSKAQVLASQYPATQALLDALPPDVPVDHATDATTRTKVERVVAQLELAVAVAVVKSGYAAKGKNFIGWYFDDLTAALRGPAPTDPDLDETWLVPLPAEARAEWRAFVDQRLKAFWPDGRAKAVQDFKSTLIKKFTARQVIDAPF